MATQMTPDEGADFLDACSGAPFRRVATLMRDQRDEIARLRAEVERLTAEQTDPCNSHGCILKEYGYAPPGGLGVNTTKCYCPEWKWRRVLSAQRDKARQRDRVIEAAFKALDAARTWEFATGREPDLGGILDLYRDSEAEARRLRAELEGK